MRNSEWEVCPGCRGEGTQVRVEFSVWTEDDRFNDPEGFEEMMSGRYDEVCRVCEGRRVVKPEHIAAHEDRRSELRMRAMEDGDWESYQLYGVY